MYAVVRYFNYRKGVSFTILKTFNSFKIADKYALSLARNDFGKDLVEGVSERWVYVDNEIEEYTGGSGYDNFVYAVMEIPEPADDSDNEDNDNEDSDDSDNEDSDYYLESDTKMPFMMNNEGEYEWGLDLTNFNVEHDEQHNVGAQRITPFS